MTLLAASEPLVTLDSTVRITADIRIEDDVRAGAIIDHGDLAVDILATMGQMEMVLRHDIQEQRGKNPSSKGTCNWTRNPTLDSLKTRAEELVAKKSRVKDVSLADYITDMGLDSMFPRTIRHCRNENWSDECNSRVLDAYLSRSNELNQIMVLAMQLQGDAENVSNHKYMAHQIAVLYQCVSRLGPPLEAIKKEIEAHFNDIKANTSPSEDGTEPRLSRELCEWLIDLTQVTVERVVDLSGEMAAPLQPILNHLRMVQEAR